MGDADEEGGGGVLAARQQVLADRRPGVLGEEHGAVLAALAEHPEALRPDVAPVERARLADPAAAADQEMDQCAVPQVAQPVPGEGGQQPGHHLGRDRMGIADDVAGHHHPAGELGRGPALVVRVAEELAERDQGPRPGARVGEGLGQLDLVAAEGGRVEALAEPGPGGPDPREGDELGEVVAVGADGGERPVALHPQVVEELLDLVGQRVTRTRHLADPGGEAGAMRRGGATLGGDAGRHRGNDGAPRPP